MFTAKCIVWGKNNRNKVIIIDCMTTAISNYSIILNIYIWNLRTYLLNFHLKIQYSNFKKSLIYLFILSTFSHYNNAHASIISLLLITINSYKRESRRESFYYSQKI